MTILNISLKIIFGLTILFILTAVYGLTFAQSSQYEFVDFQVKNKFYEIIMTGLPIAILLTLTGTIKRSNQTSKNVVIAVMTTVAAITSFFIIVSLIFTVGFLTITNDITFYQHKDNPNITITKQTIGQGAFGADGHRIVKLESFIKYWQKVSPVDTATINKSDWVLINKKN